VSNIITYSKSKDGAVKVSDHISVREWSSPNDDAVPIDMDVVKNLEKVRANMSLVGKTVSATIINSAYRDTKYNRAVGGSATSLHLKGRAVDFYFRDENGKAMPSIYILCCAQLLGIRGIERIADGLSVHIDNQPNAASSTSHWWAYQQRTASGAYAYYTLSDWFSSSFNKAYGVKPPAGATATVNVTEQNMEYTLIGCGSKGALVRYWQEYLISQGYALPKYGADGIFGTRYSETYAATVAYQRDHGLVVDGWVGPKTWASAGVTTLGKAA
jgi:hypothetical protein